MRVLALIADRPDPPITGARVRNYHVFPALQRLGVELKVLGLNVQPGPNRPLDWPGIDAEFFTFGSRSLPSRVHGRFTRSWYEYPISTDLVRRVDELIETWAPDVVHGEELRMASYFPRMRDQPSKLIHSLTFHNVESELFERLADPAIPIGRNLARRIQVDSLRRFEARVVGRLDLRMAYSEFDRARYQGLYPDVPWLVTRNGTAALAIRPAPQVESPSVLILGNWSYPPNLQGLSWYLEKIAPLMRVRATLTIVGSAASDDLKRRLARLPGVRFVDTPLDLRPYYEQAAVLAVPLLEGGGTRSKILEALAFERLVVTTPKGAEGLELTEREGVLLAETPEAFAARLDEMLGAPQARDEMARRGRQAILDRYEWSVVAAELKANWDARLACQTDPIEKR